MSSESQAFAFSLSRWEAVAVYLLLRDAASRSDPVRQRLFKRLERKLYESLTIEEFEELDDLYRKRIEFSRGAD